MFAVKPILSSFLALAALPVVAVHPALAAPLEVAVGLLPLLSAGPERHPCSD